MNRNEIVFIICVNNEQYFEEACFYINRLYVPAGYTIDIISIREAESMCAGYNAAMRSSDAKYKVYLHQDVFIRNENFCCDILHIFEDEKIGMIGVMGGVGLPKNGVAFRSWNVGYLDCRDPDMAYFMCTKRENIPVEAIDGLIMITQYDIPWREDLFKDFDFYDVSQSLEMRRAGYDVFIPKQENPWVIHDSNFVKLRNYDKNLKVCLKEYPEFFYREDGVGYGYDREWDNIRQELERVFMAYIEGRDWKEVKNLVAEYKAWEKKTSCLETCCILYDIWSAEQNSEIEHSFFDGLTTFEEINEKYTMFRFQLRHMELGMNEETYINVLKDIEQGLVSFDVLFVIIMHSIVEKRKVLLQLQKIYKDMGSENPKLNILLTRISDEITMAYPQTCGDQSR